MTCRIKFAPETSLHFYGTSPFIWWGFFSIWRKLHVCPIMMHVIIGLFYTCSHLTIINARITQNYIPSSILCNFLVQGVVIKVSVVDNSSKELLTNNRKTSGEKMRSFWERCDLLNIYVKNNSPKPISEGGWLCVSTDKRIYVYRPLHPRLSAIYF